MALQLIPASLHTFTEIDDEDFMRIYPPDMAVIGHQLSIYHGSNRVLENVGLWGKGFWMVFKWIWDSEYVEVCLRNVQEFGTLQEAIVFAHQVGDTGPQAYAEKEAYEKRISQPLSETEPQAAPKILQCPLSLIVEGDFENCVEANCAWWVNSAHSQNGCAVFVMAKKIALEVE